jgi:hypothetical protein
MKRKQAFIVSQSKFFNFLYAVIFLAIFVGVIFTINGQANFSVPDYIKFSAMLLVPGVGMFVAGSRRDEVLRMDETGIFYRRKLITSWERFIRAYSEEDNPENGLDVKFSLHIEYYDIEKAVPYSIRIPLLLTLDKSIEEIQSAIQSFVTADT